MCANMKCHKNLDSARTDTKHFALSVNCFKTKVQKSQNLKNIQQLPDSEKFLLENCQFVVRLDLTTRRIWRQICEMVSLTVGTILFHRSPGFMGFCRVWDLLLRKSLPPDGSGEVD